MYKYISFYIYYILPIYIYRVTLLENIGYLNIVIL